MGVSLCKGGNVSLTKEAPGLTAVIGRPGLGRPHHHRHRLRPRRLRPAARRRRARSPPTRTSSSSTTSRAPTARSSTPATTSPARARATTSRSRSTSPACPADVDKIVFPVSIYDAETREQNFGQVRNAFIRVVNQADGAELARYDLTEDASTETAMVFGELYRNGASGSSAPSARATPRACAASPRTSASTSEHGPGSTHHVRRRHRAAPARRTGGRRPSLRTH